MKTLLCVGYLSRHGRATVFRNTVTSGFSVVANSSVVHEFPTFDAAERFAADVVGGLEQQAARCDARAWRR